MSAPKDRLVLESRSVSHWFGDNHVLHDVRIDVVRGQIVSLVGPSGCGKSTFLRAVVGTHPPKQGEIVVYSGSDHAEGRVVRSPGRDRGIVYQRYSLFPFLTAQKNVAFGLMLDETSLPYRFFLNPLWHRLRKAHLEKAADFLSRVGLGEAIKLYPSEMSGGMRQRVAVAQALIMKPEILLLDEPFGALDEAMREELQRMLLTLYDENRQALADGEKPPYTVFIVTHELNEAIYVGDRVIGLSQYWNWKDSGYDSCPGATIIYDRKAPIYHPDEERDYQEFKHQRDEIRRVVFDPLAAHDPKTYRTYWEDDLVRETKGPGK